MSMGAEKNSAGTRSGPENVYFRRINSGKPPLVAIDLYSHLHWQEYSIIPCKSIIEGRFIQAGQRNALYEWFWGKSAKTYTTGGGGKLDGVATLVTDPPRGYSTTKQNPHICNQPLYGAITWLCVVEEFPLGRVCYKRGYPPRKPPNFQVLENMVFPRVVHGVETIKLRMVPLRATLCRHFFEGKIGSWERSYCRRHWIFQEIGPGKLQIFKQYWALIPAYGICLK